MARIENGNDLITPLLQPGWKVQGDGYGLMTGTCVFKSDQNGSFSAAVIGSSHPDSSYTYMKAHKVGVSYDSLGLATLTVEYVGIDVTYTGGAYTKPQMVSSNSLGSENITSHVNFFNNVSGYSDVIAGVGTGTLTAPKYLESDMGPTVSKNGIPVKSFTGDNGSCFERVNGGRFIGFVDPKWSELYGKTNYLAPVSSFSGFFYTTVTSEPSKFINKLGWASAQSNWGTFGVAILPDYVPAGMVGWSQNGPTCLLSNVNIERFAGAVLKISYEVRFNAEGWSTKVYKSDAS
jgi:hypothetical protein